MTEKIIKKHVKKHTPEAVINSVLGQLCFYFENVINEGRFKIYLNNRFDEMAANRSITEKSIINDFVAKSKIMDNEIEIARERTLAAINVAMYFCYISNNSYAAGKYEQSWYFATEAKNWQGIAAGSEHAFYVRRNVVRSFAGSGGRGRSDKFAPLREFSLEAAKKRTYASKRNAALSIKSDVLELAKKIGIPLSEQQAEKTICGWLDGISFASTRERKPAGILP